MNSKSILLSVSAVALLMLTAVLIKTERGTNVFYAKERNEESKEESAEAKGSLEYFHMLRANQHTGVVDPKDVALAMSQANELRAASNKTTALAQMEWAHRGPDNVGGRTRAFISDKLDSNKLYVGMVSGGWWYSDDDANTWKQMSGADSFMRNAVSCVDQAANGDLYYGTGEGFTGSSYGGTLGFHGNGIYKSTDGGKSVVHLPATAAPFNALGSTWTYVNKLAAHPTDPNRVIAAINRGLWETRDGGNTWTQMVSSNASFLDVDISSTGNVIVASTSNNIFISTDGGATFAQGVNSPTIGLPGATGLNRVECAIAPSDENVIYSVMSVPGGTRGCYRSIDKGASWTTIGVGGSQVWNPLGDQGFYDIAFGVHPTNPDILFLGGQLDLYRWTPQKKWESIAYWVGSNGRYVHADMHGIMFNSANPNKMYVITDGGIFRTDDCTVQYPFFVEKNKNYVTAQCYGVSANNLGHIIFGAQDQGTWLMNYSLANSPNTGISQLGGDGMRGAASDMDWDFFFGSSQNGVMQRSTNKGAAGSWAGIYDRNIDNETPTPNGRPDEGSLWVAPIELKEDSNGTATKSVLFIGFANRVWFTQKAVSTEIAVWFPLITRTGAGFSSVTLNKAGTVAFVGDASGRVTRISGLDLFNTEYKYDDTVSNLLSSGFTMGNSFVETAMPQPWGGRYITDLECDASGNTLLVTVPNYGNTQYIFRSTNALDATPSMTSIQGNLPFMPIHSCAVLSAANTYLVGTEIGVYGTDDGGNTWVELNNNAAANTSVWHPRVATTEIVVKPYKIQRNGYWEGDIIYTGTYGRGTFESTSFATWNQFPVSVNETRKSSNGFTVYPNPVVNMATLKLNSVNGGAGMVQVISLTGRTVKNEVIQLSAGENNISMDMSTLPKGVYMVQLRSKDGINTTKIVKR